MVKVFALIPRRGDISEQQFHEHWAGPHAQLALRITTLRRYVQSHRVAPKLDGLPEPPYDGIAEVWFDDAAAAASMGEDPNYVDHAHADEPNFIDTEQPRFMRDRGAGSARRLAAGQGGGRHQGDDPPGSRRPALAGDLGAADRRLGARLVTSLPSAQRITIAVAPCQRAMPTVPSPPSTRCWSCGSRTLTHSRRPGELGRVPARSPRLGGRPVPVLRHARRGAARHLAG